MFNLFRLFPPFLFLLDSCVQAAELNKRQNQMGLWKAMPIDRTAGSWALLGRGPPTARCLGRVRHLIEHLEREREWEEKERKKKDKGKFRKELSWISFNRTVIAEQDIGPQAWVNSPSGRGSGCFVGLGSVVVGWAGTTCTRPKT